MEQVKSFRDLAVYSRAQKLNSDIFRKTKQFPKEELYSLTDQIRRSSRSIGAQIAEAWAKRKYKKHFMSKLTDADGEQLETQHWIMVAYDCDYISQQTFQSWLDSCNQIGKMLSAMMRKAQEFCK